MKFKKLDFKDNEAQLIYNMYISSVQKLIKKLPKDDREDILMELNSHIYEAIQNGRDDNEYQVINEIISRLGDPSEVWGKAEIDFRIEQQEAMTPKLPFFEQFKLGTLYGLSYLLMIISIVLIGGKLYYGSKFGFFINPDHVFVLGGIEDGLMYLPEYEVLGIAYIPVFVLCFLLARYLINELKKDEELLLIKYSCAY